MAKKHRTARTKQRTANKAVPRKTTATARRKTAAQQQTPASKRWDISAAAGKSRLIAAALYDPVSRSIRRLGLKTRERFREHRESSPHRSFRYTRRSEVRRYEKVPAWWRLLSRSLLLLKREWKKMLPLVLIFAIIAWLTSGMFNQGFELLKRTLSLFDAEALSVFEEAAALFGGFISSRITAIPPDALLFLNLFGVILWLCFLWIARYDLAGEPTTTREALYTSPSAFVPFLLLLMLLVVQLLPASTAAIIFASLQGGGLAGNTLETVLFIILGLLLSVLSLYFMVSTIMALQVAALPGMFPWRALRNARKLVTNRRFAVLRKLAMLPLFVAVFLILTFVPMLLLDKVICEQRACWSTFTLLPLVYYILVGIILAFSSTYLYVIYRSLLAQEDDYI